jgi:hypothetical protein
LFRIHKAACHAILSTTGGNATRKDHCLGVEVSKAMASGKGHLGKQQHRQSRRGHGEEHPQSSQSFGNFKTT